MLRSLALIQHELRLLRRDPAPMLLATVMPLILMAFIQPAFQGLNPSAETNGAEHAVPGMTVMFAFILIGAIGFNFYREHGWSTWVRLRTSPCTAVELAIGKGVVPVAMCATNVTLVMSLGGLLFDMHVRGSLAVLAFVAAAFVVFVVSFAFLVVALSGTIGRLNVFSNLSALVFAGLGGALTPLEVMPTWAQAIAPATPSYWAMRAFRGVIVDGAGFAQSAAPIGMLILFSAVCLIAGAARFRVDEAKEAWV
jgi:ABC-2 type transport system permease protein